MILHIVPDEKFIESAYELFETVAPHNNEFMVITRKKRLQHLDEFPIKKIGIYEFYHPFFLQNLKKYEFVVLHFLDFYKIRILLKADNTIKFVWIGWGGDYYKYFQNYSLFLPKTILLINNLERQKKYSFKELLLKFIDKYNAFCKKDIKALQRVNFFAPVLSEEFSILKNNVENFYPKFLDWNYGVFQKNLYKYSGKITGKNILIGNSATAENNHMEIFEILENIDILSRKIILPLSYGDNIYGKTIEKISIQLFKGHAEPLMDYMKFDEYLRILEKCSVVIMNHTRQQGLGNILIMIYNGAKVYLNEQNILYQHLKKYGIFIFSLKDLNQQSIDNQLDENQKLHNKYLIEKLYGKEVSLRKTEQLILKVKISKEEN